MFRIANANEIKLAGVALARRLSGGMAVQRKISTPGGAFQEQPLRWRPQLPLWAYFADQPSRGGLWTFVFGTDIGMPGKTISPSIEINFPTEFENRKRAGRIVADENGSLYFAHKGELRGGRGGQVSLADFERLVSGFYKEDVEWDGRKAETVFVIARIEDRLFLNRLAEYVKEAERLRTLARANKLGTSPQNNSTGFKAGSSGRTTVKGASEHEVNRFHENVLKALHAALKTHGVQAVNRLHEGMRPDIYTKDSGDQLDWLFEIKTDKNTTLIYTGIGQLIVYGAAQAKPPKRVLVCPGPHPHPNFAAALKKHGINQLEYRVDAAENVTFPGIAALIKRLVSD